MTTAKPPLASEVIARALDPTEQDLLAREFPGTSPAGRALQTLLDQATFAGTLFPVMSEHRELVSDPLTRYAAVALAALGRPVTYEAVLDLAARADAQTIPETA